MWLRSPVHDELWYNQAQLGPMNGLNACKRQNLPTGAGGMIAQSVAEILGRHVRLSVEGIDRMYLNVYVPRLAVRAGNCAVLPRPSRPAAAVGGADEPDQPALRGHAGSFRGAA